MSRVWRLVFLLLVVIAGATSAAWADGIDDLIAALNTKNFSDKIAAVEALAGAADPRAVAVLEALSAGKLYARKADGAVVVAEKQDKRYLLSDPVSGAALGDVAKKEIKKIRVNNKLRATITAALGGLTLRDPDPDRRLAAARAVMKSRAADLTPVLETALATETDDAVRDAMTLALAAIRLTGAADAARRIEAAKTLATAGEPEVRALLLSRVREDKDGGFTESDPTVRAAVDQALKRIESRLEFWAIVGNLFQGLSLGSVLLLAAIGLAITFGVMGVINMAHGEMIMLGAYTTFAVQEVFRAHFPAAFDWSLFVAIPAAFLVAGLVGIAIERGIIRFLYGRPLETLLATWGLSLVLQQLVRTVFGPTNRDVGSPSWMMGGIELDGGVILTYNRIAIIVFSLLVLGTLIVILRKTSFGLRMRAVTQNRRMAASMGIRTGSIDALTFGLGSGIAGMAGVALSQIDNVSPNLGQSYIIDSFMVVVFGGVGNLWGTLVGAMSIGLFNKFLEPSVGAVMAKILILVLVILFIQKRPRGLFALKGRAVDA